MPLPLDHIAKRVELIRAGRDHRRATAGYRTWNSRHAIALIAMLDLETISTIELQVLFGEAEPGLWVGKKGQQRAQQLISKLAVRGYIERARWGEWSLTKAGRETAVLYRDRKRKAAIAGFERGEYVRHDGDGGSGEAPGGEVHGDDLPGLPSQLPGKA